MKVAIIGAKPSFNAEQYYANAFEELGVNIVTFNQYEGISRANLTRLIMSRSHVLDRLRKHFLINRRIVGTLRRYNPDVVIVFKGDALSNQTIDRVCSEWSTYLQYPDNYKFPVLLKNRIDKFLGVFVAAHNVQFYTQLGASDVHVVPWAFDPTIHKKADLKKDYKISFVGAAYPNRYFVVRRLKDVDIFGPFWVLYHGRFHKPVHGLEYARVLNSSIINLDIHHPKNILSDDVGMRAFEVAGSGNFLLSDYVPSLHKYLPKIPVYHDVAELREMISWFLENRKEREEISSAMAELCLRSHTYRNRSEDILKIIH